MDTLRSHEIIFLVQISPMLKMCGDCGLINENLTLKDREWTCECGTGHDRDVNAAKNILKIGLDTPEFKPVEKLASAKSFLRPKQAGSMKQELNAPRSRKAS